MGLLVALMSMQLSLPVWADEYTPPLDPVQAITPTPHYENQFHTFALLAAKASNQVDKTIKLQTPVKSQVSRGTCSIFSLVGILEWGLLVKTGTVYDLSEEWLEYTIRQTNSNYGSSLSANFPAMKTYGIPTESAYPYNGSEWTDYKNFADAQYECDSLAPNSDDRQECLSQHGLFDPLYSEINEGCGHLVNSYTFDQCLYAHRDPAFMNQYSSTLNDPSSFYYDPDFASARTEAANMRDTVLKHFVSYYSPSSTSSVKKLLLNNETLTLRMPVHYQAWNHGGGYKDGIPVNKDHWHKGIVSYPEYGSLDKNGGGHLINIVGYDDNVTFTKDVVMKDGTTKTFTYKGVYYFKNSWGTSSFGKDFEIKGTNYPGYGMIAQKYAHDYGQFFAYTLK